jgi:hypothetical protein
MFADIWLSGDGGLWTDAPTGNLTVEKGGIEATRGFHYGDEYGALQHKTL